MAQGLPSAADRSAPWAFAAGGHASARGGSPSGPPVAEPIPGRYIVVLSDDADPNAVARSFVTTYGLAVHHVYRAAFRGFAASIPDPALPGIARDPSVAFVSPDRTMYAATQNLPTGVDRIEADRNGTARIDGADARVDAGIAIIDTGVDLDHPDLNVVFGRSFVAGEPTADDPHGHGTHVAGTAAALDNGIGVVGVAPGARIYALKVLDATGVGSVRDIAAAIDWVAANAGIVDVTSLSLGGLVPNADDGNCGRTNQDALHLAICNAVAAGVTVVVAAGNDRVDAKDVSPAAYDEVLTVSGLSDLDGTPLDDRFTFFSNFGADVDLIAPGRAILSTWRGGGTAVLTGTSMSTPHVSGAAALYIASVRAQTGSRPPPAQVATFLKSHGESAPSGGWPGDSDGIPEPLVKVRDLPAGPIDATASVVAVRPTRIEADGESTASAIAMPRDAQGNLLGPGHPVQFFTPIGDLLGAPTDGGTDLYTQSLRAPVIAPGTITPVTATVDSVPLSQAARLAFTEDIRIHGPSSIAAGPEDEIDPAVASNGAGYLVAWWTLAADRTTARVWATRVALDGTPIDPTPRLLDTVSLGLSLPFPRIASDGANYLVVWLERGALIRASDGAVLASLAFQSPDPRFGAAVGFGGGRYLVVWYVFDQRVGAYGLEGHFVRPDGTLEGRRGFPILSGVSPATWISESPAIAFDGSNFLIAFSRMRIGPCPSNPSRACALDSDVWAVRVSPSGSVLAPAFLLSEAPGYQRFPSASSDGARSLVAWESVVADVETGAPHSAGVDALRLGLDGAILDVAPIRLEGPPEFALGPAVAPAGMGTFLVAWTNASHPDDWDVSGARIRGDTGQLQDPEGFAIALAPADQIGPSLAASESNLLVSFMDFGRNAATRADVTGQLVRLFELPLEVTIQAPWSQLYVGQTMDLTLTATVSGAPLPDAAVSATLAGGTLTPASGTTDSNGVFTTVVKPSAGTGGTTITVDAIVSKVAYTPGSDSYPIYVVPSPLPLSVAVTSKTTRMMSLETATIRVRLTSSGAGVSEGLFTLSDGLTPTGTFGPVTDYGNGDYSFGWTAPTVTGTTAAVIGVSAKVGGYASPLPRSYTITVDPNKTNFANPTTLFALGLPDKTALRSGESILVRVVVYTIEGYPVTGAAVAVTVLGGGTVTPVVDELNGLYTFRYTAPTVTGDLAVLLRVSASKYGYKSVVKSIGLTVSP